MGDDEQEEIDDFLASQNQINDVLVPVKKEILGENGRYARGVRHEGPP